MDLPERKQKTKKKTAARKTKTAWPKTLSERVQVVEAALHRSGDAVTPAEMAKQFSRAKTEAIAEILQTLVTLGRARKIAENKYSR